MDVIVPALNEERYVILCLASIARQTLAPRKIILIDDGSRDHTVQYARTYAEENRLNLEIIRRRAPVGKTPTLKRQSREDDADVLLILDTDTELDSDNYIERVVEVLFEGARGRQCLRHRAAAAASRLRPGSQYPAHSAVPGSAYRHPSRRVEGIAA